MVPPISFTRSGRRGSDGNRLLASRPFREYDRLPRRDGSCDWLHWRIRGLHDATKRLANLPPSSTDPRVGRSHTTDTGSLRQGKSGDPDRELHRPAPSLRRHHPAPGVAGKIRGGDKSRGSRKQAAFRELWFPAGSATSLSNNS